MKSLKQKVIMSAVVLVFALIATIGSTYAWFTVSNQTDVNSFDIYVESSEALLIKVYDSATDPAEDGSAYNSATYNWQLDDFENVVDIEDSSDYDEEIAAAKLSPITCLTGETQTVGATNTYFDTDYTGYDIAALRKPTSNFLIDDGNAAADGTGRELEAASANTPSGGYIELKFWLLKPAGGTNDDIVFDYTLTDNDANETYENAIFIGTIDSAGTPTKTIFGDSPDTSFTWLTTETPGYYSSDTNLNSMRGTPGLSYGTTGATAITTVADDIPEIMTVVIWVEGWDVDATNALMAANFTLTLTFTLTNVA